jgi:alkanesulfonate monooxygenase SsuD/methylene tetrahydromethanopterin reductase-like flavin-dependent oxidoreductase (luciferase family)
LNKGEESNRVQKRVVRRYGFVDGLVGEHATDKAENITSSALFIATLAGQTKTIRLGTGTVNMPDSHPADSMPRINAATRTMAAQ